MTARAPYGRAERRPEPDGVPYGPYAGETYYGRPALKQPHYRWSIAHYFFVGGLAGASQVIAMAADLGGRERDRGVVRAGRYLALAGSAASPLFLIWDLHSPRRWYNMLRIFRPTSPMSFGSWALTAFGGLSGLVAAAQVLEDLTGAHGWRAVGRGASLPAAALGLLVTTYTGVLVAATSVPLWASVPRALPALFGASAMSAAAAALTLVEEARHGPAATQRRLSRIALVSSAAELALGLLVRRTWRAEGVDAPVGQRRPAGLAFHAGFLGLGVLAPLAVHVREQFVRRPSPRASRFASAATLAGSYALRAALVFGGRESARRPEDYFRFTRRRADTSTARGEVDAARGAAAGTRS